MIGSNKHKFIFFHLYKVAGTSMRRVLGKYQDFSQLKHLKPSEYINNGNNHHILYDDYFTFSFVRNPWDWQVSLYHYMLKDVGHKQHRLIKSMNSFDEYIDWRVNKDCKPQYTFLSEKGDSESEITLDFIGKFESLTLDFEFIKQQTGVEGNLPHDNKSKRTHYKDYFTDNSRKLIEDAYKIDIDYFGYSFENDDLISGSEIYNKKNIKI